MALPLISKIKSWFTGGKTSDDAVVPKTPQQGTVVFFNKKKGYGFIKADKDQKDIFVHITDLKSKIRKGDKVEYIVEREDKGWRATQVRRV